MVLMLQVQARLIDVNDFLFYNGQEYDDARNQRVLSVYDLPLPLILRSSTSNFKVEFPGIIGG